MTSSVDTDTWKEPAAFTTGQAAKIGKVSQQTIIRCFDNQTLKGFRVPGSRFRRIPRNYLFQFLKDNGMDTSALSREAVVAMMDVEENVRVPIREVLGKIRDAKVIDVPDMDGAEKMLRDENHLSCLVVDEQTLITDPRDLRLDRTITDNHANILGILGDNGAPRDWDAAEVFDAHHPRTEDPRQVAHSVVCLAEKSRLARLKALIGK